MKQKCFSEALSNPRWYGYSKHARYIPLVITYCNWLIHHVIRKFRATEERVNKPVCRSRSLVHLVHDTCN